MLLLTPHLAHITLSQSRPSLSPSDTPSAFHSRLNDLFQKSFPQQFFWFLLDAFHGLGTERTYYSCLIFLFLIRVLD